MKQFLSLVFVCLSFLSYGQSYTLNGDIFNDKGKPVAYSTAVLLNPADSTLEFYAIANKEGQFAIKNVKKGSYLLQVAYIGHETVYKTLSIPNEKGSKLGVFILNQNDESIEGVEVIGEHVPISIKKDTVEYNASAFKTKSGTVVEDLLKKLPGVKVDRAGNIKAMGEDVKNVLVDGKEFFGNDPKVASKNLPADAIDKVQLYNKKSDESEFMGIDDGSRDKTINLMLKDDKKNSLFGDLIAGYGTDEHYKASAKAYRFNNKIQLAALGMLNNINQFGFSFSDYLNFNGGIGSLMSGGGSAKIEISDDNSFPVNFGQPVTGLFTSGAGGFNFSYSKNKNDRFFVSYLANKSNKFLEQNTSGTYFTDESSFIRQDSLNEKIKDEAHRLNIGYRNRINPNQNLILNASAGLMNNTKTGENYFRSSFEQDQLINAQDIFSDESSLRISGNINGSYIYKLKNNRNIFKLNADAFYSISDESVFNENEFRFDDDENSQISSVFQDNLTNIFNYTGTVSLMQKTNKRFYLIADVSYGAKTESLNRIDGPTVNDDLFSVETGFIKQYTHLNPGISFKRNTKKTKLFLRLETELGQLENSLNETITGPTNYWNFIPRLSYELEYNTGRRLSFSYNSGTHVPTANQLLPVVNKLNPLSIYYGNPNLLPEYSHSADMQWWIFDQFSFTSLMASIRTNYTTDKINWSTSINEQLEQTNTLVNVDSDFSVSGSIDFSTPIRKLGLKINLNIEESYNEGINFVNSTENKITNHGTKLSLSAENRKKEKIDIISGLGVNNQNANYSIQTSLNRQYLDVFWYGEVHYSPFDKFDIGITADLTKYSDKSFSESINIPLINAELNFRFLKKNRGQLTLNAFDILNQNTGIRRISELNYLREVRSNTLGRYVMIAFKYRINKFDNKGSGIDIDMKGRR